MRALLSDVLIAVAGLILGFGVGLNVGSSAMEHVVKTPTYAVMPSSMTGSYCAAPLPRDAGLPRPRTWRRT